MSELDQREIWLIRSWFAVRGFERAHSISDIRREYFRSGGDIMPPLNSLIFKKVLSTSPDKQMVKFTDYGYELVQSFAAAQKEWEKPGFIKVGNIVRDKLLIRAGEYFTANRILREIFGSAMTSLKIIDPYFGSDILDVLQDTSINRQIKVVTSTKISASTKKSYEAFRSQFQNIELRVLNDEIHDRFVVCDERTAYHVGHSLKDLGGKDCQINVDNASNLISLFEERWAVSYAI